LSAISNFNQTPNHRRGNKKHYPKSTDIFAPPDQKITSLLAAAQGRTNVSGEQNSIKRAKYINFTPDPIIPNITLAYYANGKYNKGISCKPIQPPYDESEDALLPFHIPSHEGCGLPTYITIL
jgi:hypothetical protein